MDWQSVVAAVVAFACGIWAVRMFVSPFLPGSGDCASCAGRRVTSSESLLEIETPPSA